MASPPARSFFAFSSFLQWFFTLFAAGPAVPGFYTYDASIPARNGDDPNQRTLKVAKTCDEGGVEQDARKGETLGQGRRFILDSGASYHVAGDISLLSSVTTTIPPTCSAAAYRARDGRHLPITGVGTVSRGSFQLHNVLLAPDLCSRVVIVSVTQLAEHGNLVMFGGGQCYVKEQNSGKVVGKGRWHGDDGLYHLEYLDISPDTGVDP